MTRRISLCMRRSFPLACCLALVIGNAVSDDTPAVSGLRGYQLQPLSKTLTPSATQALRVVNCALANTAEDDPVPLVHTCEGLYDGEVVSPATISAWSVNGVVGGNSTVGTIKGNRDTATYTAPAKKPTPGTVAVSAKVNIAGSQNPLVVANITISDLSKYSGKVTFSSEARMGGIHITDGVAQVTWTLVEDLPDVRTYTASGTISGKLAPEYQDLKCKPVPVKGVIDSGDKLVVYTDRANWSPSTYGFALQLDNPNTKLTTTCTVENGPEMPISFPNVLMIAVGGNCLPDQTTQLPVPFTDPAELQGKFDCPGSKLFASISAQWTFKSE